MQATIFTTMGIQFGCNIVFPAYESMPDWPSNIEVSRLYGNDFFISYFFLLIFSYSFVCYVLVFHFLNDLLMMYVFNIYIHHFISLSFFASNDVVRIHVSLVHFLLERPKIPFSKGI